MEPVHDLCHRHGVPPRPGSLCPTIIPARKSIVQCCFTPSPVCVVCAPAHLRYRHPIIAEHTEILAQLRAAGETVSAENLASVSPLAYAHVIPNGIYHFDRPLAAIEERSQALA